MGTGPLSPDFTGIDPEAMGLFIAELERARGVIGEQAEAIRRVFAANDVPAASLSPIGEVEAWIDGRLPELRRRSQMARDMATLPGWLPGTPSGLVAYQEKQVLPAGDARRQGRALADAYLKIDPYALFDPGLDAKYQKIMGTLSAHAADPEFTGAFFGALGVRRTLELPKRLRHVLQEDDQSAVELASRAFATAISGGATAAGFPAIREALMLKADTFEEQTATGDLLSAGRFPTEWLAQVVTAQVLLPKSTATGVSLTPYLNALAKDPGAARLAISLATKDSPLPRNTLGVLLAPAVRGGRTDQRPDLVTFLKALNERAVRDATSADAFGRLLASAAGAYDETEGGHSERAARFAFTVITTADEMKIAASTRIHLSEIAGAYASEMTEGANLGDDNQLMPSAFGAVSSRISGLKSMFRLSPKDTYRFIKTFADTDANLKPFENGMGNLARRLINAGVPSMVKSKDPTRMDEVFAVLGNVRGLELAAAEKLRKAVDDSVEESRKGIGWARGGVFGVVGLVLPVGMAGSILWTAVCAMDSTNETFGPEPDKQVDKLRESDDLETLARRHAIAQTLMDAGFAPEISLSEYQAACPPGVAIVDSAGRLRPFADIAITHNTEDKKVSINDEGLQALDQWFIANGMGGKEVFSLGEVSKKVADIFDGRKNNGQARAKVFDR